MQEKNDSNKLLNEMAVYKTELAKGSIDEQYNRIKNVIKNINNINDILDNGKTYLIVATVQYKADIVKLLLENGANPNIVDISGISALAYVFLKKTVNREEIIKLLLDYGADPLLGGKPGQNAFDFASICKAEPYLVSLLNDANLRLHEECTVAVHLNPLQE